jgi:hypothetical protein
MHRVVCLCVQIAQQVDKAERVTDVWNRRPHNRLNASLIASTVLRQFAPCFVRR